MTALYPRRGSCLGFGLVDMFENQQLYSDKLDQIVLKNALMASHNKLLVTGASGFDIDDLRDWSKEVHRGENLNGVTWFSTAPLPGYILDYIRSMRNGIKEESGANDFSRGMATGGVTAASAIAALQEMSSKREPHGGQGHTRRIRAGSAPGDRGGEGVLHIPEKGTPEEPHRYIAFQ